jgi:2-methylcitrate dehydratase
MFLAETIADYAVRLRFEDLDARTVHEVCRRLLDSLACACGAYRAGAAQVARRVAKRVRGVPGAHFLGGSEVSSPELAAFVNGVLFRYLDYNDTYLSLEPAHPSDNFAAVLAAADYAGCSGQDIVTATVLAYEIQCRMCDAASIRAHGWDHVTYGAFSTAAAAGKLLGLDAPGIVQTLNLAGTPNITLRQTRAGELSEWKGCAFANASRNGIFAALLAAEGLTGPAPIFEGELGFFKQVSGAFELPNLGGQTPSTGADNPAVASDFMINKTSIKFWPAEYHSQSAIHAALELRRLLSTGPRRIRAVSIYSFDAAVDIIGKDPEKWRPKTRETADHSLPFCTAVALLDGDVTLDSFSPERLSDPVLLDLISKIEVFRDPHLTARYPAGIPNRIVLLLDNASMISAENEFPRGHDQNPMTDDEVIAKFQRLARGVLSDEAQQRVIEFCWNLPRASSLAPLWAEFPVEA